MTTQPQTEPSPLDPATLDTILRGTLDALSHHPDATAEEIATKQRSALIAIASFRPRDPAEAMLASRYIGAYHATMDAFRCAAQPDLPPILILRFHGKVIAMSRLMDDTMRELQRLQANPCVQPAAVPEAMPAPRPRPAAPVAAQTGTPTSSQPQPVRSPEHAPAPAADAKAGSANTTRPAPLVVARPAGLAQGVMPGTDAARAVVPPTARAA